ncbi:MAG TPA: HAD-IB family hydrolase [Polyangiaceae bacterium]|jgi:HAD superfamily hydrolase (TIGR01490 family)|nr:HAD-IB family hydrolase [Polyangiaceae bacterium]
MAASYFDVDGTLVSTNLVHPALFYLVNQPTPLEAARRIGKTLLRAPAMLAAELVDRRMFNELLFQSYEGMSEDRLELLAEETFRKVILPSMYPHARALIDKSRAAGHEIVFVSGTLDFILRHISDHLGGATLIANRLEMKNLYSTGKLLRPVVAGPQKAQLIREHARNAGHDLEECWAFSDSYSDLPMLSVVGHPAAVNPDPRLRLLAKAYSWPTLNLSKAS